MKVEGQYKRSEGAIIESKRYCSPPPDSQGEESEDRDHGVKGHVKVRAIGLLRASLLDVGGEHYAHCFVYSPYEIAFILTSCVFLVSS